MRLNRFFGVWLFFHAHRTVSRAQRAPSYALFRPFDALPLVMTLGKA
jgi:hypothetical protein